MNISKELFWDGVWPLLRLKGIGARDFLNGQTTALINNVQYEAFKTGVFELDAVCCTLTMYKLPSVKRTTSLT